MNKCKLERFVGKEVCVTLYGRVNLTGCLMPVNSYDFCNNYICRSAAGQDSFQFNPSRVKSVREVSV
jgi:hypothetical protein